MPLYEYECRRCHHRFERIQKFSDPPARRCPSCKGSVRKLISAPGIRFKGTGWYITDYARKGRTGESSEGDSKKADSKATEGGTGKEKKTTGGEGSGKSTEKKKS
ncbi:MAG: zinc ribbon domain-containing protein [Acidobacteria bacterium]|nr:zinc ribbon domain-containing protein [Acidobacteriota bacterium]